MSPRIVTYVHRPKRPARKRVKASAPPVPSAVTASTRKQARLARAEPVEGDPEADARVKAFFDRMIRPP